MNYRHAYHAGNAADVVKHTLLARALLAMARKEKPFTLIDTHGGAGLFDLAMDERALRSAEAQGGVLRVLEDPAPHVLLAPWLEAIRAVNAGQPEARFYPGSPLLAAMLTRPDDRIHACELHPEEAEALRGALKAYSRASVHERDGYGALSAFLPPPSRRGIVLIDPPFEKPGEYERMIKALAAGLRRFATGVYLLWRPIKAGGADADFLEEMRGCPAPALDLRLRFAPESAPGLIGTGLTAVNPPWGFEEEARALLAWLAPRLAAPGFRGEWEAERVTPS